MARIINHGMSKPRPYGKSRPCTAAPIGSGPEGETCKTCAHYTIREWAGKYRKCGLMERFWTHGLGSDIKAKWAACRCWEKREVNHAD